MKKRVLGRTGLEVTEFCLGLLPMGPGQRGVSIQEGAGIIRAAFEAGVTFFDTAKGYRTQPFVKAGLGADVNNAVIATKSSARDDGTMAQDVEDALREIGRDYIDVMHLHAARDPQPFKTRTGALERLLKLKDEGVVKAVGVATHYVDVVLQAAGRDDIDVVFPLTNLTGMGILDGSHIEMATVIKAASEAGKGVYVMKPLAGGNLLHRFREAVAYARGLVGVSAVALGVVTMDELRFNLRVFNDEKITDDEFDEMATVPKRYVVLGGCDGCGICVDECPAEAVQVEDDQARIIQEKCILCGYCALACPGFWIRLA